MKNRIIGHRQVSAIGLGEMPLSIEGRPDRAQATATIHAALDAGVTLIDTADAYCLDPGEVGHGETLIAEALAAYGADTSNVLVATKGGHLRPGGGRWRQNGDPAYLKQAARASAARLGVDAIGLYQFSRPDPQVPFAESIGALADLLADGVIEQAGICDVSVAQIDEARSILGDKLVSVQNEFSPRNTDGLAELEHCESLGLAFLPWSPLGGMANASQVGAAQSVMSEIALAREVSPYQVVLAWELSLAPVVIPIPGASRPASITDSAKGADLVLDAADLVRIGNYLV